MRVYQSSGRGHAVRRRVRYERFTISLSITKRGGGAVMSSRGAAEAAAAGIDSQSQHPHIRPFIHTVNIIIMRAYPYRRVYHLYLLK